MTMEKSLFGQIAIAQGWIDQPTLERCLSKQQSRPGQHIALGQILVRQGLLTQQQVEEVLKIQRKMRASHVIEGYELLTKIATGGMGTVYKARKKGIDKIVALKILSPSLAKNKSYIERFFREARTAGMLNHPNIVGGFDVGESAGYYYFAMEYAEGETASRVLAREGKLPEALALNIVKQVAVALDYAMKYGLIHRDIKPGNIIITPDGSVKLSDLGLAKVDAHDTVITQEGRSLCSPQYSSPEQARGDQDIDTRSDIYSLGVTLFHLVTGRVPFDAPTPAAVLAKQITEELPPLRAMKQEMSEPVARLIRKAMEKNRDKRYASPAEFITAVDAAQVAMASKKGTASARKSNMPWISVALGAVAAIAAIVFVITALNNQQHENQQNPQQQAAVGQPTEPADEPNEADPEKQRAEEARAALRQVMEYKKNNPQNYDKLLPAFQVVIEGYAGTEAAEQAKAQRQALIEKRQTEAENQLKAAQARADELAEEGRFADAIDVLKEFATTQLAELVDEKLQAQIDEVRQQAADDFARTVRKSEELAAEGRFDEARNLVRAAANKTGLEKALREADARAKELDRQEAEHRAHVLAEKQREGEYRLRIYEVNDLVSSFDFEKARQEYQKLQNDCPQGLRDFLQARQTDVDLLADLRDKIIGSLNQDPNAAVHVTLRSGRRISSQSAAASDSGLKLKIRSAELSFGWDQLSPDSLYDLAEAAAPDQDVELAILAHYTGNDRAAERHLEKAAENPATHAQAQKLAERFTAARTFKQTMESRQMLAAAADLIQQDKPEDARELLLELRANLEKSDAGEPFADQINDMLGQINETLANQTVDEAMEQAKRDNWKAVSTILVTLKETYGDTRTVRETRAADIDELEFKAQRLVVDRRLITGLQHFLRLEDGAARNVFSSLTREKDPVTAADAEKFLDAMKLEVNLPGDDDCGDLAVSLKRVPDPWQRVAAYRTFHRRCRGSSWEAHARARIALIFLNELNRPMIAREIYQMQLKDFPKHSYWCAAAYVGIGRCESSVGDWEEAEKYFDAVPRNYPDEQGKCAEALHEKAQHYLKNGETETAVDTLEQAVKKYPLGKDNTSEAQITLAEIYRDQLDDKQKALKNFREVYFRTPDNPYITPRAMMAAADILRELGENAEAHKLYRNIIEQFSTTEFAAQARGKL